MLRIFLTFRVIAAVVSALVVVLDPTPWAEACQRDLPASLTPLPETPDPALELVDQRTRFRKVHRSRTDATGRILTLGAGPLHYLDGAGRWRDIDTRLVARDGELVAAANSFHTTVRGVLAASPLATLSDADASLGIGAALALDLRTGGRDTPLALRADGTPASALGAHAEVTGGLGGHLLVRVGRIAVEESLLLPGIPFDLDAAPAAAVVLRQRLVPGPGLAVRVDDSPLAAGSTREGTRVVLRDASGATRFALHAPVAFEAEADGSATLSGMRSRPPSAAIGHYRVTHDAAGLVVEAVFPSAWLASEERAWPVALSATVSVSDTTAPCTSGMAMRYVPPSKTRASGLRVAGAKCAASPVHDRYERLSFGDAEYAAMGGRLQLAAHGASRELLDWLRFDIAKLPADFEEARWMRLGLFVAAASARGPSSTLRIHDVGVDVCAAAGGVAGDPHLDADDTDVRTLHRAIDRGEELAADALAAWPEGAGATDLAAEAVTAFERRRASGLAFFQVGLELDPPGTRDVVAFEDRAGEHPPYLLVGYRARPTCVPAAERCNGRDDDCDGAIDEGFAALDAAGRALTVGAACGLGACAGGRVVCAPGELAAVCSSASTARAETCDGTDEDCDGRTDDAADAACTDARACTEDRCLAGHCEHAVVGGACLIDGTCIPALAARPGNPCEKCQPDRTQTGWSPVPDGTVSQSCYPCSTGRPGVGACQSGIQWCQSGSWSACTGHACPSVEACDARDNDCDGVSDEGAGDDGLACTTDHCTDGAASHEVAAGWCVVDGACHSEGSANPASGCEVCYPPHSLTAWSDTVLEEDFESPTPPVEARDDSGAGLGWQRDERRAFSGQASLYFGDPTARTYERPGERVRATARTRWMRLPTAIAERLTFMVWLDTEEAAEDAYDALRVYAEPERGARRLLWSSSAALGGTTDGEFRAVSVDLGAYAGARLRLAFEFDSGDEAFNAHEGVYLDDIHVATGCCAADADCDDGAPCTSDTCLAGACRHTDTCAPGPRLQRSVIVDVDRSRSMDEDGRWALVAQALEEVLPEYEEEVDLALNVYPVGQPCNFPAALELPFRSTASEMTAYLAGVNPWSEDSLSAAMLEVGALFEGVPGQRTHLLVTDGGEWCGGDPVAAAAELAAAGIATYVVGVGEDVDHALLGRVAEAGGQPLPLDGPEAVPYRHALTLGELREALGDVLAAASGEVCNGRDDDGDGVVDEDVPPVGCHFGCNGGLGGVELCEGGAYGPCSVEGRPEQCNGRDDDCDGEVDEDWFAGTACVVGIGECRRAGRTVCTSDGTGEACSAVPGTPTTEACDGRDNDCDGRTDEPGGGDDPGLTEPGLPLCEEQRGVCGGARKPPALCVNGAWRTCGESVYAAHAIEYAADEAACGAAVCCDALDNDCDESTDEGFGTTTCGLGPCRHTVVACVGGLPQPCDPLLGAEPEVCDGADEATGIDNDCDGEVNELPDACDWLGVPGADPPLDLAWLDEACTDGTPWGDYVLEAEAAVPCRCGFNPTYGVWSCFAD